MDRKNNNNHLIGLYEKALPDDLSLEDKLSMIGRAGYSFMEISIDHITIIRKYGFRIRQH